MAPGGQLFFCPRVYDYQRRTFDLFFYSPWAEPSRPRASPVTFDWLVVPVKNFEPALLVGQFHVGCQTIGCIGVSGLHCSVTYAQSHASDHLPSSASTPGLLSIKTQQHWAVNMNENKKQGGVMHFNLQLFATSELLWL